MKKIYLFAFIVLLASIGLAVVLTAKKWALEHRLVSAVQANNISLILKTDSKALKSIRTEYDNTLLHYAESEAMVELLVSSGLPVDGENSYGNSPLHFACANLNVDVATTLVKYGADANFPNKNGERPLDVAISGFWDGYRLSGYRQKGFRDGSQRIPIIILLLQNGSDPNLSDSVLPPLHASVRHHDTEILKVLLDYGVGLDILDRNGETAVEYAKGAGRKTEWVKLLENASIAATREEKKL